MRKHNRGFTLIEVSIVMALGLTAAGVGVVQIKNSISAVDANTAGTTVVSQLRYAREVAVNQRHNVSIVFTSPSTIAIQREEDDGSITPISTTTLPTGFSFGLPAAAIGDTPDGYGDNFPVDFADTNSGTFLGDGTFVNSAGIVISGTVYTIGATDGTARAITLSGTNGRAKQYYIHAGAWHEKT